MHVIFQRWWKQDTRQFSIVNHRPAWRECNNKPRVSFWTNGAKRGVDRCLDVTLIIGYTIFNYSNFNYNA